MFRPLSDVITDVRTWIRQCGLSYKEISKESGVNLTSIYRLVDETGDRVRYGSALKRICKFANITIEVHREGKLPEELRAAVLEAWDGSPAQARNLARAIRALGDYARTAATRK